MTSTIELDRPIATRPRRRRRWPLVLAAGAGAVLTTAATGAAYVVSHAGNRPLPAGVHTVEVYTVDDAISTVVAPKDRPGVVGRFLGMCDADTYYVEAGGTGLCLVLNGSLGSVRATGTAQGARLDAGQAAEVRDIVRQDERGAEEPDTRVVLKYDDGWAGLVKVADLEAGGPVTGTVIR
ncbi:hypothetical protein ACIA5C_32330 [Actinoplanes sp. NPDC051343]|uniref:hypothetical protein n=1 Tax=Actinoplanes sp. NPDC051343 TaxID=3363906 RepID=UPI00378D86A3